jgi:hypothetical protein
LSAPAGALTAVREGVTSHLSEWIELADIRSIDLLAGGRPSPREKSHHYLMGLLFLFLRTDSSISGIDFSICFFACERRRESKMTTSALAFSRVLQFH